MFFKVSYTILIITFIIPLSLTGCYTPIDSSEVPRIVSQEPLVYTGLPGEIGNNPYFRAFISDKNGLIDKKLLPFRKEASFPLELNPMRIDNGQEKYSYFDIFGNPVFVRFEEDGIKFQGYSPDRQYASEVVAIDGDVDSYAFLWDIKEKKFYQFCTIGPDGKLIGMAWLDRTRFILWSTSSIWILNSNSRFEDWIENIEKFVSLYNLNNLSINSYSSQLILPERKLLGK